MQILPMQIVDGHPVVELPRGTAVIDTGSPITLRAPRMVSDAIGRPIEWIVGTDVLRRQPVLLDGVAMRYVEGAPLAAGDELRLTEVMGVFTIALSWQGGTATAFLDSGAKLSYALAAAVDGLSPVGHERDFLPGFGTFEVPVHELDVVVGTRVIRGRFGVLPEMLQLLLSMLSRDTWILGSDFFRDRRILLDLASARVIDVTEATAGANAIPDGRA